MWLTCILDRNLIIRMAAPFIHRSEEAYQQRITYLEEETTNLTSQLEVAKGVSYSKIVQLLYLFYF